MIRRIEKTVVLLVSLFILANSMAGFQEIASGTGSWIGEYSFKWGALYFGYILFSALLFAALVSFTFWNRPGILKSWIKFRERIGVLRLFLAVGSVLFPIYFFQFTVWGIVFHNLYIRVLIWALTVTLAASFLETQPNRIFSWNTLLIVVFLSSSLYIFAAAFLRVTSYPFSLGWSEGNRMWDYSVLFGRSLYDYPADQKIYALIDIGRQAVGGLPFLFSGVSIDMERFWLALTILLPYLLLGFALFRFFYNAPKLWLLGSLWVLLFLKQGPIHPPLILCAALVALVWRSPLWIGLPLIMLTGHLAHISRFTWLFAPGIWIVMLEMADAVLRDGKLAPQNWVRAGCLGLAGIFGGYFGVSIAEAVIGGGSSAPAALDSAISIASNQSLLWYRLLPNATYSVGVLFGLAIAVLPLLIVLIYLSLTKKWDLNIWQKLALILPSLAFLAVGLVVSAKIGGGGDLHNLDMFLIGLVFASAVALKNGGLTWLQNIDLAPFGLKLTLLLLIILPALQSLADIRSYNYAADSAWLLKLTDLERAKELEMYPAPAEADAALDIIRAYVTQAQATGGEVLFIDQRQLLTFGYIQVKLVPEYEKKLLMEMALNNNAAYFDKFYSDLKAKRFALIVSEPLRTPLQGSSNQFGEENNAWVRWVSFPVLCYYEPVKALEAVNVQLLQPNPAPVACDQVLP